MYIANYALSSFGAISVVDLGGGSKGSMEPPFWLH